MSDRIDSTPGICGGCVRIRGTRIPVWSIVQCLNRGLSAEIIAEMYPALESADIQAACQYRDDHPQEIAEQVERAEMEE